MLYILLFLAVCASFIHVSGIHPFDNELLQAEEFGPDRTITLSKLPPELKDIEDVAKNVSHLKSAYQETDEADEKEVRRSIVRKLRTSKGSKTILELLELFRKLKVEKQLKALEMMEELVHEYEVAISFAIHGGIKIIVPLLASHNEEIVLSVARVLGSAMQSNLLVQKAAKEEDVGVKLIKFLSSLESITLVPHIVFAVSAYLRNFPEAQEEFIIQDGIRELALILTDINVDVKIKLRIVNLISDLVVEQQQATELLQGYRRAALQRAFASEIRTNNICERVPLFLYEKDYDVLEKTVSAMIALNDICNQDFNFAKGKLNNLLKIYDPLHDDEDLMLDEELKSALHEQLKNLIEELESNSSSPSSKSEL